MHSRQYGRLPDPILTTLFQGVVDREEALRRARAERAASRILDLTDNNATHRSGTVVIDLDKEEVRYASSR